MVIAVLNVMPLYSYYSNLDKQQWREAAGYLESSRNLEEFLFVNIPTHVLALNYYYPHDKNTFGIKNIESFKGKIGNRYSFWLVYTSEAYGDPKGELKAYLDKSYNVQESKEYVGIRIFHYKAKES